MGRFIQVKFKQAGHETRGGSRGQELSERGAPPGVQGRADLTTSLIQIKRRGCKAHGRIFAYQVTHGEPYSKP
jgi:hypothetical protein